jgi:hypothetical protein
MSPFGQQFFASASPVLTLAPQAAHHHQVTAGIRPFSHQVASNLAPSTSHLQLSGWAPAQSLTRGRKRSRDEAAVNLDSSAQSDAPSKPPAGLFSNGAVLPQASSSISPTAFGTTSTTQLPLGQTASDKQQEQHDRPLLRSHKSQRLDQAAIVQQQSNSAISSTGSAALPTSAPEAPSQPVVDDFTLHLGIGWRRISEDVDIQAAARGWARFIENHYPISCTKICLESKGLQSYLVEAAEGYFLFSENLREGRLVSPTVEGALRNLKGQTPVFEGVKMIAGQSSVPQGQGAAVVGHADVDMDI